MDDHSVFYKYIEENQIDMKEVIRINNERLAKKKLEEGEKRAAAAAATVVAKLQEKNRRRKESVLRLERERVALLEEEREKAIAQERRRLEEEDTTRIVSEFFTELNNTTNRMPTLSPLSDDEMPPHIYTEPPNTPVTEVIGEGDDDGDVNFPFPNPSFISTPEPSNPQTHPPRQSMGKNSIDDLKRVYTQVDFNGLEEHKDGKNYRRTLCFKKKDILIDTYAILNRYDRDVVVTAENKFKELKYIYNQKQKGIKKLVKVKDQLATLEMMAARYVASEKVAKKNCK